MHECLFTAAGCTAENGVMDVASDGVVAYASGKNVLLDNVRDRWRGRGRIQLLPDGPQGHVHAVRLLVRPATGQTVGVAAASADGWLRVWRVPPEGGEAQLMAAHKVSESALVALAVPLALSTPDGSFELLVADALDTLFFLSLRDSQLCITDQISHSPRKIVCLAATRWEEGKGRADAGHECPSSVLVAFVGLSDNSIAVLTGGRVRLGLVGHTNWVNSLACTASPGGNSIWLASGSSDKTIRVWKLSSDAGQTPTGLAELLPARTTFDLSEAGPRLRIFCEAVIYGHEGMVNSVRWAPPAAPSDAALSHVPRLVSASADRSVFVWRARGGVVALDHRGTAGGEVGGWDSELQLGDISGMSTAAGYHFATLLADNDDGNVLLAHGSTGSIVQYAIRDGRVQTLPPLATGHTLSIRACDWEPTGRYLLTCSLDQSTRIWAASSTGDCFGGDWCEIARPQIHGYDMVAVQSLGESAFISAGDEKILRSFQAPSSFLARLRQDQPPSPGDAADSMPCEVVVVPALGLSNKLKGSETAGMRPQLELPLHGPPSEGDLARMTLWMETDKLYGHGLELYTVAVSPCRRLAASASRATTPEDAVIRLWERLEGGTSGVWKPLPQTIAAHTLTVVRLAFSPDGRHLLSVSRDRHWALSTVEEGGKTELQQYTEAHSRIIWSCAWAGDGTSFLTGSRDRTVKTWRRREGATTRPTTEWDEDERQRLAFSAPVTALALHPKHNVLAVGLENGAIILHVPAVEGGGWRELMRIGNAHASAVNEIRWCPRDETGPKMVFLLLASVSDLLQLHRIPLHSKIDAS